MNKLLVIFALSVMALLIACQESKPTPLPTLFPTSIPTTTPTPTPTPVPSTTTTFKISAGGSREFPFDLRQGNIIEYSFEADLDFNFTILDRAENVVVRRGRVIADEGRFQADKTGRYTLKFDNGFSLSADKTVTLTYRVLPDGRR